MSFSRIKGLGLIATAAVAVAAAAAPVVLATSGVSQASTVKTGRVKVCNTASYWSYVSFPRRHGFASYAVQPGHCWAQNMGNNGTEPIQILGLHGKTSFKIGTVEFNGGKSGIGITTTGTVKAPNYYAWSAVKNGHVRVCNTAKYPSYVSFPRRGDFMSTVITPGTCWSDNMGSHGTEPIKIFGLAGTASFPIGTVHFNGGKSGIAITTAGTAKTHYYYV
jgi:hypothetical protein